ncbi:hypothetical protein KC460_02230 [Candidatus Dependentiae bacterium]|nr:hypothetical protein [Candidatus Dependentiae bacterium]
MKKPVLIIVILIIVPLIFSSYRTGKMRIPQSIKKKYQPNIKKYLSPRLKAWYRSRYQDFTISTKKNIQKHKKIFLQSDTTEKVKNIQKKPSNWTNWINTFSKWFNFGQTIKKY